MAKTMSPTKVITSPETLWSYVHVTQPQSINGSEPKYSIQVRIKKTDTKTIDAVQNAMRAAYEEGQAKLKGTGKFVPPYDTLKKPLRDGDLEFPDDETMAGYYFINANNRQKPGVVDRDRNPILNAEEIYSGCFGRCSLGFFAYNSGSSKGIACAINNLQKWNDGPRLGGHATAEEDFAGLDDVDDFLS